MIFLIFSIAITTIWILGITILQKPEMLLGGIRKQIDTYLTPTEENATWFKYYLCIALKPVIFCPSCMSSVHGTIIYLTLIHVFCLKFSIFFLMLNCICTVPIVYFTSKYIE